MAFSLKSACVFLRVCVPISLTAWSYWLVLLAVEGHDRVGTLLSEALQQERRLYVTVIEQDSLPTKHPSYP